MRSEIMIKCDVCGRERQNVSILEDYLCVVEPTINTICDSCQDEVSEHMHMMNNILEANFEEMKVDTEKAFMSSLAEMKKK
jgi:hypothetical protein